MCRFSTSNNIQKVVTIYITEQRQAELDLTKTQIKIKLLSGYSQITEG